MASHFSLAILLACIGPAEAWAGICWGGDVSRADGARPIDCLVQRGVDDVFYDLSDPYNRATNPHAVILTSSLDGRPLAIQEYYFDGMLPIEKEELSAWNATFEHRASVLNTRLIKDICAEKQVAAFVRSGGVAEIDVEFQISDNSSQPSKKISKTVSILIDNCEAD